MQMDFFCNSIYPSKWIGGCKLKPNRLAEMAEKEGRSVKELLIEAYESHGSQTGVAAALGISQSRLSQIIKELNLREKRILVPLEGVQQ
jgi:hypothetical protein